VPSLVLPLVYDTATNLTQLAEKRDAGPASAISAASLHMKRFAEFALNHNECSIFPAIRDLMTNFVLPSEPQPQMSPASMNMHPQMTPGGPVPSPLMGQHMMNQNPNMVGPNPNMGGPNPNMVGQNPNMVVQNPNMVGPNPNMVGQNPNMVGPGCNNYGNVPMSAMGPQHGMMPNHQ